MNRLLGAGGGAWEHAKTFVAESNFGGNGSDSPRQP